MEIRGRDSMKECIKRRRINAGQTVTLKYLKAIYDTEKHGLMTQADM